MNSKSARMRAATIFSITIIAVPLLGQAQDQRGTSNRPAPEISSAVGGLARQYKLYDVGPPSRNLSVFYDFDASGGLFTPSPFNNAGQLAGAYLYSGSIAGSYLWSAGNTIVLPNLPNADIPDGGSNANGVNDAGTAIGASAYGAVSPYNGQPFYHAVSWRDGNVQDLGTLGGGDSWANYINNRGLVIGYAYNATPDAYSFYGTQYHATSWSDGKIRDLGTLGGTDSEAWTANDRGEVIGISLLNTPPVPPFNQPQEDAFLWSKGQMRDLGTLGGNFSTPTAINQKGQVTVLSFDSTNLRYQSFLWSHGRKFVLAGLGGGFVEATTLNDFGIVTGASIDPTNTNFLAEVWLPTGQGLPLGTIGSDTGSIGLGINQWAVIVGGSGSVTLSGNNYTHAFVWQLGTMKDLNTLIPAGSALTLNVAYAINQRGEIAGLGTNSNGDVHAFVLVPQDRASARSFATAASAPAAPGSSVRMASPAARMLRHLHQQ